MITTIQPHKADSPPRPREVFRRWLVTRHYSPATVNCYVNRLIDYAAFFAKAPAELGPEQVNAYLSHLANDVHVTAKTQRQALCALVRFYESIEQPLGDIGKFQFATRPPRLPVVLSKGEVTRLLAAIPETPGLMARLTYGCGLRLMECCRLRVKDLDFERHVLMVRGGKGDKDRQIMLPESIRTELQQHLHRLKLRFDQDGGWLVHLPGALVKKFPHYERDWRWQFVFPSRSLSTDQADGRIKRHHVQESTLQKAVKRAAELSQLTKPMDETTRQQLYDEYRNEMDGGFGFGDPKMWRNGPRNFAAYLAHRRIANDFEKAFAHVVKVCADHPTADIRHTWNQTHVVLNGLPAGEGIKSDHEYLCSVCLRKLEGGAP